MKFPGGIEIQLQDQPPPVVEANSYSDFILSKNQNEIDKSADVLPEKTNGEKNSDNELLILHQQYEQQVSNSRYWKFSYLSLLFVHQTKSVLSWFTSSKTQTRQSYNILWTPYIFDQNQRNIILNVLLQYGMLSDVGGLVQITDEGFSFLRFIGVLPPVPVPPSKI